MPARSTRPPSKGYPGTKLNAAKTKLMFIRYSAMAIMLGGAPGNTAAPQNPSAINTETSGPAMAIRNSAFGVGASRLICAMPPKMNRVICEIGIRYRNATMQWPSSCTRTETKSRRAATIPKTQYCHMGTWRSTAGKYPCDNDQERSAKTMNQDTWTRNGIPRTRPICQD